VSRDKNARAVFEAYGIWGICATAGPDRTVDELANSARFGNRNMMVALSDELLAEGFQVIREPDRDWPDALIVVSEDEPAGNDWDRLRVCMIKRGLTANPNYRGK
jgi:hypothetical protein